MISPDGLLVTLYLFSYNQEAYIKEACESALAQNYSPLEIIFSDDCSSDRTFELMEKVVKDYSGPHKVKLNKNQKNLGLIGHINKAFEVSEGELIVVAAGDDVSVPRRVGSLVGAYLKSGKRSFVIHSSASKINDANDDLGVLIPPIIASPMTTLDIADSRSIYIGATAAYSRDLYKKFGPIVFVNAYEDLVFGFRGAICGAISYVDLPLVHYRVGVGISSYKSTTLLQFKSRLSKRRRSLQVYCDVFEQRLIDLDWVEDSEQKDALMSRLIKNIALERKRLLFYSKPLALVLRVFSPDFVQALRALNSEIRFIVQFRD